MQKHRVFQHLKSVKRLKTSAADGILHGILHGILIGEVNDGEFFLGTSWVNDLMGLNLMTQCDCKPMGFVAGVATNIPRFPGLYMLIPIRLSRL